MVQLLPLFRSVVETSPSLSVPLWQVLLLLLITCIAAAMERHRLVLVIAYVFLVHWVFIENLQLLAFNQISVVTILTFLLFGLLGLVLTLYQMLTARF